MKRWVLVIGSVVALLVLWSVVSKMIPSYTDYRGQKIKLSRYYFDYDEYKNDPDNIDSSETARVQRLVIVRVWSGRPRPLPLVLILFLTV